MWASLADQEAEQIASEVVASENLTTLPVCPFTLANKKGIYVAPKKSSKPGVSGFLMLHENQFGIQYATHIQNEGFIRFTVAHELGHYFIPGHPKLLFPPGVTLHESRSGFVSDLVHERQADVFATALLMPEGLFRAALQKVGAGFAAIEFLKNLCKTSITSTALRYVRVTDDPAAVIMSDGDVIDYCFISDALLQVPKLRSLRKGSALPPRSETAKFNRAKSNITSGRQASAYTSLDEWFDEAPEIEMKEDVVGLGSYGKTLTVLFTQEAIEVNDDQDSDDDDD
jgi:Zn-dependent peptidase ImmA (M78 family)